MKIRTAALGLVTAAALVLGPVGTADAAKAKPRKCGPRHVAVSIANPDGVRPATGTSSISQGPRKAKKRCVRYVAVSVPNPDPFYVAVSVPR